MRLLLPGYFEELVILPPLDRPVSDETEDRMREVAGGLCLALAESFHILDAYMKNPRTEHWDRVYRLFDFLL